MQKKRTTMHTHARKKRYDNNSATHTRPAWVEIHRLGSGPVYHRVSDRLRPDPALHTRRPCRRCRPVFLKNMTLWWGCPAILAELTLKTGSVGMMAIGFAYLALRQQEPAAGLTRREQLAPKLCSYGLIAELVTAGVFYVVCNLIWPNFYFEPVQAGKNVWLAVQGISIAFYVVGVILAFSSIRNRSAMLGSAVVR